MQDQQSYWNENLDPQNLGKAGLSDEYNPKHELGFYFTPDQKFALEQLRPLPGKRVLDIGAGIGTNALHLAAQGSTVVAMDIAHERLIALRGSFALFPAEREQAGRLLLVRAAAEALPFRDAIFDAACSKSVLIHTQLEKAVPEIQRVLRHSGIGTFIEPLKRNPFVNLYRRTLAPRIWQSIARYFGETELELFRRSFPNVTIRNFYLTSFFAFAWQFGIRVPLLFRASLVPLHELDCVLMRIPGLAARAWFAVIVVRK